MDMDRDSENQSFARSAFYAAAGFIFFVVILFASISIRDNGTLGHWEIATCLLGTGMIAVLIFLPHFLQGILDLLEENKKKSETDLLGQAYFELKEIRTQLDALEVKIDKVPTLVDKIVTESTSKSNEGSMDGILEFLESFRNDAFSRINHLEETFAAPPLLPEEDTAQSKLFDSIQRLSAQVKEVHSLINALPIPSVVPNPKIEHSEESGNVPSEEQAEFPIPEEPMNLEVEDNLDLGIESLQVTERPDEAKNKTTEDPDKEEFNKDALEAEQVEESSEISGSSQDFKSVAEKKDADEELALGLPDPKETLRKVDALLAGEKPQETESGTLPLDNEKKGNGTTTVVANVMIGIGNKPYLRGEGPGLSWEEGVSMNFVEIGKWAWSPPMKNAPLTVQIFRNDKDPDKGGKIEVKPGQKLEITPDFS